MLFTIKQPKSKRFFQLSFKGFLPEGRSKYGRFVNSWAAFFHSFGKYVVKRVRLLLKLGIKGIGLPLRFPAVAKEYLTRKLIWSRGRLGRPVAMVIMMATAFFVFMLGEVFNSSKLVVKGEVTDDYLARVTDIIPKKEIATTTIPEERKRTEAFNYNIQSGDSLSSIGEKFKISVDALEYVNNLTEYSVLKVGQSLTVPPVSGLVHKVESGDTLTSIASKYSVPAQSIADFNYILDTSRLAVGSELVVPGAKVPQPVYIPPTVSTVGLAQATPSKNYCVWPSTVRIITQYFSWYHNGIDVATPTGGGMPPLFSCTEGKVIRAGWDPWGLGLHVRIDHGNGYETVYGHMSRIDVGYGQTVKRGQIIGLMGSTGRSTGPHVHYMVKFNGVAQDPIGYTN